MIDFYSAPTPNGYKVAMLLEETGLDYQAHFVNLFEREQKEDWFLTINPNGQIPAIIDHDLNELKLFESGAILIHLAEKTKKFIPFKPIPRAHCIQWLMFQMSALGPMQNQTHFFKHAAPQKLPLAIDHFHRETERIYDVLEGQLKTQQYLIGAYSIADMAVWPWVRLHLRVGVSLKKRPHLLAWLKRIEARPATQRALLVPKPREWPDYEA